VFGWTEFFTVYTGKHCLCWNVVKEKYCSGWKNKPNKPASFPAEHCLYLFHFLSVFCVRVVSSVSFFCFFCLSCFWKVEVENRVP